MVFKYWIKNLFLICLCVVLFPLQADAATGSLHLTVIFNGKPVAAAVAVTPPGRRNHTVLQTEYVPENTYRHMKQTPFDLTLPAGKYDLYVHANVSPINIYMQTRALPIKIDAGGQLSKTVIIPSGRLQLNADIEGKYITGMDVDLTAGATYKNRLSGFENFTKTGRLKTPVDFEVPPGKYSFRIWNQKSRQSQKGSVRVGYNRTGAKILHFAKLHAGYLNVNVIRDGHPVLAEDISRYLSISVASVKTGRRVYALTGSYGVSKVKLPAGVYNIKVHVPVLNVKDQLIKNIRIRDEATVVRNINIQQPGKLVISAQWSGQPLKITHFGDCFNYYNPFNSKRLGALMGGPSVARGKCADSDIKQLVVQVSDADGQLVAKTGQRLLLLPGIYSISVWPEGQRQLEQTLKNVTITAGSDIQKQLKFSWREKNK